MKTIDDVLKHGNNRVKPLDTDIEAIQEAKQDLLDIILKCKPKRIKSNHAEKFSSARIGYIGGYNAALKDFRKSIQEAFDE